MRTTLVYIGPFENIGKFWRKPYQSAIAGVRGGAEEGRGGHVAKSQLECTLGDVIPPIRFLRVGHVAKSSLQHCLEAVIPMA